MTTTRQAYNPLTGQFNLVNNINGNTIPILPTNQVATTDPLTATYNNGSSGAGATLTNSGSLAALVIDDVSVIVGDRILVKNQASSFQNGIYVVTNIGSGAVAWILTRAADYNSPAEIKPGQIIPVGEGTINANTLWLQNDTVTTVGTDPIEFSQFSAPAFGTVEHAVLVGGANNTVVSVGPSVSGTVFVGNTGGDPDFSSSPTVNSMTILDTPIASTDAVNKAYADSISSGFTFINSAQAASTANLTASYDNGTAGVGATLTNTGSQAAFAIDGYTALLNDRILVKNQTAELENGIYTVTTLGSGAVDWVLTRATDFDAPSEITPSSIIGIINGTMNANTSWVQVNVVTTVGIDPIHFNQFGSAPISTTQYASLVGDVNNAVASVGPGTAGQIYLATGVSSNPAFVTPTAGTGLTGTFNGTTHSYALSTPVSATNGGTGLSDPTAHSLLVAQGASAMAPIGPGTAGQLLLATGVSSDPSFVTPTAGTGLTGTFNGTTHSYAIITPIAVANGGTGVVSSTNHAVLLGAGSSPIGSVGPGTAGQLLLATGASSDPSFVTATAGTGLTGTFNGTTFSYALSTPVSVANGGTGAASLAAHGVVIAEGSSAMTVAAPGVAGQLLLSTGASSDPSFVTPTAGTGLTGTFNGTTHSYALTTPVSAANGGTGVVSPTAHTLLVAQGASAMTPIGPGATGTVLIGNTGADPSFSDTPAVTSITISNAPSASTDGVNKAYVDALTPNLNFKNTCYAATTGALTATYSNGTAGVSATLTNSGAQAAFSIDGVSPAINSRILVKDQGTTFQNGIYTLTTVGSGAANWVLTRAADYNQVAEINAGDFIPVEYGTANASTTWMQSATVTAIGTDAVTFNAFSSGGIATPVSAVDGGTGLSSPTANSLLVAQGASAMTEVGPGTAGQLLLATGVSSDPAFVTPTAGTGLTGTFNGTTHSYALTTPVSSANGGTGAASLAAHGLVLAQGASAMTVIAPDTAGKLLLATGASTDPAFITPTAGTGLTGTFNGTTHSYALTTPVSAANGGTGAASLATHCVVVSQGSSAMVAVGPGTAGQLLLSKGASTDPGFVTPTAGTGLTGTFNATTHSYALTTPVTSGNGGTGLSSVGSSGNVLTSNGSSWVSSAPVAATTVSVTTPGAYPYTTLATDYLIKVDTSSARTITPLASPATGQFHIIKDSVGSAATNNITVTPSGKNIDGAASYVINLAYGSITIIYNGTEWSIC